MSMSERRVLLLLFCSAQCLCNCPLPPSGSVNCNKREPTGNFPNTQVAPPSVGSCDFQSSFCNYTQGCRDPDANNWTQLESYAEASGQNYTADHSSFLLSPVLRIDHTTCLKFNASVHNPSTLSVHFGDDLNNSCTVTSEIATGQVVTFRNYTNIRPGTGQIFFRARSGGNSNGYVRLCDVSLVMGGCEDPFCSFDDLHNDTACEFWEMKGWTVIQRKQKTSTEGKVAVLQPGLTTGTLKTDLVMAKGNGTACVQFFYLMTGINDRLAVSAQPVDGRMELLWEITNTNTSGDWIPASVPHVSHSAFFISFQGQRCHASEPSYIAIDEVKVFRYMCNYLPLGSNPSSQQRIHTSDPSCDLPPGSGSADVHVGREEHVPAIVGAVAGVVLLAVVGVALALVIRRMRNGERGGSNYDKPNPSDGKVDDEISMSTVISSAGDYTYVTSTAQRVEASRKAAAIAPYEVVEDGVPGQPLFSSNDDYNVLNVHGSGQNLPKPHGYSEEHYTHINNQPGSDRSEEYSEVQKKGDKHVAAHKPTTTQKQVVSDDYNVIDLTGHRSDAKAVGLDGVEDTYNRLDKI